MDNNEESLYRSKWDINLISDPYNDLAFISTKKPHKQKKRIFLDCDSVKTKYQRMEEVKDVKGFVVNIHGPTDFDIDFNLPDDLIQRYNDVVVNKYGYKDIDNDFNFPLNSILSRSSEKEGRVYRCRLRKIGLHKKNNKAFMWKSNQLLAEINHLINRTDGWVRCNLLDIDVFRRLLIDIIIDTKNGSINLTDYLLNRMKSEEEPIFFEYMKV